MKKRMSLFNQQGMMIVIEGVIGVGKTTLSKAICEHYRQQGMKCKYYPEHVNIDFLNLFISDMKKYAFAFQMYMLERRLQMIREAEDWIRRTNGIAILDRSLHGDYTFALLQRLNGNMTDQEWNIYENIIQQFKVLIKPKVVFYLDASVETCLLRCKKRDRKGESSYTADYFDKLTTCYKQCVKKYDTDILISLDWNQEGVDLNRVLSYLQ